jgi:hypothetical protein
MAVRPLSASLFFFSAGGAGQKVAGSLFFGAPNLINQGLN